jgi:hypothetical protein
MDMKRRHKIYRVIISRSVLIPKSQNPYEVNAKSATAPTAARSTTDTLLSDLAPPFDGGEDAPPDVALAGFPGLGPYAEQFA